MVTESNVIAVKCHLSEITSILALNDKAFRKFYRLYTGEKVSVEETNEARLILVKMLAQVVINDIEEVFKHDEEFKEYDFLNSEEE